MALVAGVGLASQVSSTAQTKTGPAKKPTSIVRRTRTVPPKTASAPTKTVAKSHRRTAAKPAKSVAAYRGRVQQQPTADRFKEIQQALLDRGYFSGPVDGTWGPGSVDALKRFQAEQSLTEDGKIGSLSLIALGLGPKRTVPVEASTSDRQSQQQ